ncbi:MAG TPA: serine/threonine-protein kinase [Pyrinomonadaceae bacterium]|nr:serine/threonine-protein kinase [Pyrinomonadaceae bacterium]
MKVCPDDGAPLQADPTVAIPGGTTDPLIGTVLDKKYRLDLRIGTGGMGTVYRATHLLIDRPVAVKVLNPRYVEDEAAQTRFRREARAAGRLQHSNAVTVTDFGRTSEGLVYIVMELLEGRTLRDVLGHDAPLDVARAVSIMLQIAAAVGAAHKAGIIHRDLKPANIFIVQRKDAPPFVKVLDFGIAKLAADVLDEDDDPQTLTQVGAMIGTPRYMSPEQCDGATLTPAADVYSLGIILYEMLTGTTPFNGTSPLAIALKHSSVAPRSPREFVATIPNALEEVVLHALEKPPEQRPADAEAFRQELYGVAERLGLEHADVLSAPTLETLRSAGTETPSGRLVIDIERLRQSRAAASVAAPATQPDVVAHSTVIEDARPTGNGNSSSPGVEANGHLASQLERYRPPAIARMRIFFGKKKTELKNRPRKARAIIILAVGLVVAVGVFAIWMRKSSAVPPVAGTIAETSGSVAAPLATEAQPGASPAEATEEKTDEAAGQQPTRSAREPRRNTRGGQQPKRPSRIKRAWEKAKRIFNPF